MVNDQLAGKEMTIGRYYLRQGDTLAAIGRFKTVVDRYQTTSHTPEALYRLVEAYLTLGLLDEAKKNGAVLGYNYPGDAWYARRLQAADRPRACARRSTPTGGGQRSGSPAPSPGKTSSRRRPTTAAGHRLAAARPRPPTDVAAAAADDAGRLVRRHAAKAPKQHWCRSAAPGSKAAAGLRRTRLNRH